MYDAGKIIAGIIIFLIVVTFPVWYLSSTGQADYVPQLEVAGGETECIEDAEYMRENHMILLDGWRDDYVREDIRTYIASNGKEYPISLSETCLGCHTNKTEFCDQCHDYTGVKPYCWDCHIEESSK